MKRVVSISLGSHRRDHEVETEILGERFLIQRIGMDGDMDKAAARIRELDGKVDVFGMGGIDLFIQSGHKRYMLKDAQKIAEAAQITPIVDGSGLKNTLERRTVRQLSETGQVDFRDKRILLVCGVDRFGLAEALVEAGAQVTFGDLIFGLGVPLPIKSLKTLSVVAGILGPVVSRLPFEYLYPTGKEQELSYDKNREYYENNEIIAGDFHYIRKYLPQDISGKTILTNTVTADDVMLLAERGACRLITTTPELQGRSFGTNVMEAVLVALLGKPPGMISPKDYHTILDEVKFQPRIVDLSAIGNRLEISQ